MVAVPAPTPETTPAELMIATVTSEDVHGTVASGVPDPVRVIVEPAHTTVGPEITGVWFTVIAVVLVHPVELVKVMVAEPPATAVSSPLSEIVATAGSEEDHGVAAAGVVVALNVVVVPLHNAVAPEITGTANTVMLSDLEHPDELV